MDVLYNEGVVESDSLVFVELTGDRGELLQVRLEGQVICRHGVRVRVLKWMEVRHGGGGRAEVLSAFYQYHAWRPKAGRRREQAILRYDQAHGGSPHRHVFDSNGQETASVPVTFEAMPRLDAVIREAVALAAAAEEISS